MRKRKLLCCSFLFVLTIVPAACFGQKYKAEDIGFGRLGVFAGAGGLESSNRSQGAVQFGGELGTLPPGWFDLTFEGGYIGPWANFEGGSALFSCNYRAAFRRERFIPFATVGYTRLFGTGNAVNFGGGVEYLISSYRAIRIEVRDYDAFTTPQQHNVALRVGFILYGND